MTTYTVSIPFEFDYVTLGTHIRAQSLELGLSYKEIDVLAGVSDGTTSALASHSRKNPQILTWLPVVNALDLDPREYFVMRF